LTRRSHPDCRAIGRGDWASVRGLDGTIRAKMVAKRFEDELGYGKANVSTVTAVVDV
jgi:hypothetical protein